MQRIGWIGTGVMGASMCGHLLAAGHPVTVTTRTRTKADALVDAGASWADSPADVAAGSDVVFVMVGYPAEVEHVVLGDDGVLSSLAPGGLLVDMTTSRPALAVEIARRAADAGVAALDAPVSGGDVGARDATLSIIRDYKVVGKHGLHPPIAFRGLLKCTNPACIVHTERVPGAFVVESREPLAVRCDYCERSIPADQFVFA